MAGDYRRTFRVSHRLCYMAGMNPRHAAARELWFPHIAWATKEARMCLVDTVVPNLRERLCGCAG